MSTVIFTPAELLALAKQIAPLIQPVTPPPPVPPVDPAGVLWIFNGGTRDSAGDYSWGSGKVTYGSTVLVAGDEGWQPLMPAGNLDMSPYKSVLVSIMPTQAHTWISGMLAVGDVKVPGSPSSVDIMPYGPKVITLNAWNDFKIPLSLYGTLPFLAYKIMFLAQNVPSPSANSQQFRWLGLSPT